MIIDWYREFEKERAFRYHAWLLAYKYNSRMKIVTKHYKLLSSVHQCGYPGTTFPQFALDVNKCNRDYMTQGKKYLRLLTRTNQS